MHSALFILGILIGLAPIQGTAQPLSVSYVFGENACRNANQPSHPDGIVVSAFTHTTLTCHAGTGYGTRGWPQADTVLANRYVGFSITAPSGEVLSFSPNDSLIVTVADFVGGLSVQGRLRTDANEYRLGAATLTTAEPERLAFPIPEAFSADSVAVRVYGFKNPANYFLFFSEITLTFQTSAAVNRDAPRQPHQHDIVGAPYPNPASSHITLPIHLAQPTSVRLTIVDLLGRSIATLADGVFPTGTHQFRWNGASHPRGLYLFRFETPLGPPETGLLLLQ